MLNLLRHMSDGFYFILFFAKREHLFLFALFVLPLQDRLLSFSMHKQEGKRRLRAMVDNHDLTAICSILSLFADTEHTKIQSE